MAKKKAKTKAFSVKFPENILKEIDALVEAKHTTRTSWLINAAEDALLRQRNIGASELIHKLSKTEYEQGDTGELPLNPRGKHNVG